MIERPKVVDDEHYKRLSENWEDEIPDNFPIDIRKPLIRSYFKEIIISGRWLNKSLKDLGAEQKQIQNLREVSGKPTALAWGRKRTKL